MHRRNEPFPVEFGLARVEADGAERGVGWEASQTTRFGSPGLGLGGNITHEVAVEVRGKALENSSMASLRKRGFTHIALPAVSDSECRPDLHRRRPQV